MSAVAAGAPARAWRELGEDPAAAPWVLAAAASELPGAWAAWGLPLARAGHALSDWRSALDGLAAACRFHDATLGHWLRTDGFDDVAQDPALSVLVAHPEHGPPLRRALAGRLDCQRRVLEVQAAIGRSGPRALLLEAFEALLGPLATRDEPWWTALIDGLRDSHAFVWRGADFRLMILDFAPPAETWSRDLARRDLDAALAWLADEPSWRRSWEVQRFGVGETTETLSCAYFHQAVIRLSLHEAGVDQSSALAGLLAELPGDVLRWYGPEWDGIPPDADSLGILLEAASHVSEPPHDKLARWRAWCRASLGGDGLTVSWFYEGPEGRHREAPSYEFPGQDCTTVRLHVLLGLLAMDLDPDLVAALLPAVSEALAGPAPHGDHYYTLAYTRALFLRLATRTSDAEVQAVARQLRDRWVSEQAPDGGWGSPQDTALAVEGLALFGAPGGALTRGLRYLGEHQRPDGSWAAQPFYRMPGKSNDREAWYQGQAFTTALCARALAHGLAATEPR